MLFRSALKLDPNFGVAKASLGEACWRKYAITKDKRWTDKAKAECDAAVTLGNAGAAGHICLGLVNTGAGQYREAVVQFQRAVELEPGNESAAIGLASALEHEGAIDDAERAYQRVVDSHPQSYFAYNSMGGFYYRRSDYEKAIQMFQKVTQLAPEGYVGYLNLGGTYNDVGRFLEAIEPLKKSVALRPSYLHEPGYVLPWTAPNERSGCHLPGSGQAGSQTVCDLGQSGRGTILRRIPAGSTEVLSHGC